MGEQNPENFILTLGNDNLLLSILLLSSPIGVFHNFLMTWVFSALLLLFFLPCFLSMWVFFHEHLRTTGLQGKILTNT